MRNRTWLIAGLFCMAWFLLLFRLDSVPPGLQHDQMFDATNALYVLDGHFPIYFPANFGLDPAFMYTAAGVFRLTGGHYVWSIRFTSALFAMLGLAATFVFARRYLTQRAALFTAALMAGSFWFLLAGRIGLEPIALLPLALACFYFLLRAGERPSLGFYVLAGVLAGAANFTYLAARTLYALPPILLIYELTLVIAARLRRRDGPPQARARIGGLLAMFFAMALVSAPLQSYLLTHPSEADGRVGELSGPLSAAFLDGNLLPLLTNVMDTVRAVVWDGSAFLPYHYNLPGRAVLQPVWAIFFVMGLLAAISRPANRREFLLLAALLLGLGPNLLTSADAIHMRGIYTLPLIFIIVVRGAVPTLTFALRRFRTWRTAHGFGSRVLPAWFGAAALLGLLSWHIVDNATAYFREWALAEPTQRIYNADFRLAARYLDQNAGQDAIFIGTDRLIDLDSRTYDLYEPRREDVNWFRLPGNPALPAHGAAIYLGPTTSEIPSLLQFLQQEGGAEQDYLYDDQGRSLMWSVRVTPETIQRAAQSVTLQPLAEPVTYDTTLRLDKVGWQDYGTEIVLVTQWTSLGPWPHSPDPGFPLLQPKVSLSFSDETGYQWIHTDAPVMLPVHNVRAGLPMIELTRLSLPSDMPAGDYILRLVLYDDKAGSLAMRRGTGPLVSTPVPITTLGLPPRPVAEAPVAPFPAVASSDAALRVLGSWERPEKLLLPVPTNVHVTWQAQQNLDTTGLAFKISAQDAHGNVLWQQTEQTPKVSLGLGLSEVWEAGRSLRLTHTVKPADTVEGKTMAHLRICAENEGITLDCASWDDVEVVNIPPRLTLSPPPQQLVGARWGDILTLAGYDLMETGADWDLMFYWQANTTAPTPLKRFVHLLGADGNIVAQSDVPLENDGIPVVYWRSGEYVLDRVQFASSEIRGVQTVCVGIYDPATEQRVAVLTAAGEPAPDARLCLPRTPQ